MKLLTDPSYINRQQWRNLIDSSPVTSIFQTPEMYDFYISLNLYEVTIVAVEDNGLKGLALCVIQSDGNGIKRNLTSRAIINGGPLLSNDISEEALAALLNETINILKRCSIYIETRNLNDYSCWRNTFEKCGYDYMPHYNFHIDTTNPNLVDKRIDKSRRRRIRRATENGVVISNDISQLHDFYNMLSNLYRTKIHKPLPPYSMFEKLSKESFSRYFFVNNSEGEVIGGQLILTLGFRVAYAWYCCGLDKEYHDLYPSIMANYAAIHYAANNGFLRYDMMGAGKPDEDYGVRDFKAQFGGALVEHGRFIFVCRPVIYNLGKIVINILTKQHNQ